MFQAMLRFRPLRFLQLPVALVALCFVVTASAGAQVQFNGVLSTVAGGGNQPTGIAVDPAGNLYEIIFGGNQQLKQTLQPDGTYVETSIGTGFAFPTAVAIDPSGNLFIPDPFHNSVAELSPSGGTYTRTTLTLNAGVSPNAIAIDSSGNLYVGSNGNNTVYLETRVGAHYNATAIVGPLTNPTGGIAVDLNNVVYITDPANNQILVETPSSGSYTQTTLGTGLSSPTGVTVDTFGNVYIADSGNHRIVKETLSGGVYTQSVLTTGVSNPQQLTVDSSGNLYIANDGGGNFLSLHIGSVPFGTHAVGTSSSILTLPFTLPAGTTLGSVAVLTTGASGKDFADSGSSTCTAQTYASDTDCVVNIQFSPLAPGVRRGAVILFDGSGNPLATVPLYGTGTGPQASYTNANPQTFATGLSAPYGLAIDDAGNVFIADSSNSRVLKVPPAGAATTVGSGFSRPIGLAVDGAGNLYVSDINNQSVTMITPSGTQTPILTSLAYPFGVTVDGAGSLYIVNTFAHQVLKLSPSGVQSHVGGPYSTPVAVAIDAAGNAYVVDYDFGTVVKVSPSGVSSTFVSGLNQPAHITLDPAGNLYIAEFGTGNILMVSPTGTKTTIANGTAPFGIANDSMGNLYFSNTSANTVRQIVRSTPPSLSFANTAVGYTSIDSAEGVFLQNTGNADLNFSTILYPTDFPEQASASDCQVGVALVPAESCTFTVDFKPIGPLAAGTSQLLSESISLTTNLPTPTQNIPVSGTEFVLPAAATPVLSVPGGIYNNAQTVTITDSAAGATIYYTLNGTTPTRSSKKYTGPIAIRNSYTLTAVAFAPGFSVSVPASAYYNLTAATPVVTPSGATTIDPQVVTITTDTVGATLLYTTNGANPNANSLKYTGPISINSTQTLKVVAIETGFHSSPVVTNVYNIQSPPATPSFSPAGGTYNNAQMVTLSDSVPGTTIYYTLNGTTPTTASRKYTGPISIKNSYTIQAIAVAPGYAATSPVSATYSLAVATPVVSLAPGIYTGPQTVSITTDTSTAQIYYTTNGATPSGTSTRYTGPINVNATETLKFVAFATGYTISPVVAATYTIQ